MTRLLLGAVYLGVLLQTPCLAATAASPAFGQWVVVDSACSGCQSGTGPETGAHLVIDPAGVKNPFAVDCEGAVTIEETGRPSVAAVFKNYGLPKSWRPSPGTNITRLTTLTVFCNGMLDGRFVQLGPNQLLMPYEADTVIRLRREQP